MIKAVIFDYYGVMCPRIAPLLAKETAEQFGTTYQKVHALMDKLLDRLDDSSITFQQYWKLLKTKLRNKDAKLLRHYKIWESSTMELHLWPEMTNLVMRLRKAGYKVPLLTNVTKTMAKYNRLNGRYKLFRPIFLSCYLGMRKPSKKIYRHILEKLGLKPSECVFVDDQKDYLKGAESIGIKTIQFKNYNQVVRELKRYDIHGI